MNRLRIFALLVLLSLLLLSCGPAVEYESPGNKYPNRLNADVTRICDYDNGIVCYYGYSRYGNTLYCVPVENPVCE